MHDQLEFIGADIAGAGARITHGGLGDTITAEVGDLGRRHVEVQRRIEFAMLYVVVEHPHALGAVAVDQVLRRVDKCRLGTIVLTLTDLLSEHQQVLALVVIPGIGGDLPAAYFNALRHLSEGGECHAVICPSGGDARYRHQQSHQDGPPLAAYTLHAIHPSTLARDGLLYRHLKANAEKIVE